MKNLVLLLQSETDTKNLENAARWVVAHGVKTVWCLMSPALLVSAESATAQIDKDIADLKENEKRSAAAGQYNVAEQFRKSAEAKTLDKAKAIADAYKLLPAEDQAKRARELVTPFGNLLRDAKVSLKVEKIGEHFETGNWVNLLNSYLKVWPETMPHGSYAVAWAGALVPTPAFVPEVQDSRTMKNDPGLTIAKQAVQTVVDALAKLPVPKEMKPKADPNKLYTGDELEKLHHLTVAGLAKNLGVFQKGQPTTESIRRILDAQTAAALT